MFIALFSNVSAQNSAEKIVAGNPADIHIGGYAQVDFNLNNYKPYNTLHL